MTEAQVNHLLKIIVPRDQLAAIEEICRSAEPAEAQDYAARLVDCCERYANAPAIYETDGKPDTEKMVVLHYFCPSGDWYILEVDHRSDECFGLACLFADELGYISLGELRTTATVELDLHWSPKSLAEVKSAM